MKKLDSTVVKYLDERAKLDNIKGSLFMETGEGKVVAKVTRTDKIMWADKLKAIAAAIPEQVWISGLEIRGKNLILACHVHSAGKDHLNDIALFIKNIKGREEFKKVFNDVKFQSALKDKDLYHFTLTFPLARDMVEKVTETIEETAG
ncbi:hypothetical protein ACFL9T_20690 [Thermodesulfobacteriota bacterium]